MPPPSVPELLQQVETLREQLRQSEDRFRTLTAEAPVGIFLTDARGALLSVNGSWCRLTGLSHEPPLGQGWMAAIHPEDRAEASRVWDQAAAARREFVIDFRALPSAGHERWLSATAVPIRGAEGDLTGYLGTLTDITEHRAATALLAAQRAFLRQVIDLDPNFIFAKDRQGRFTLVNQAVADAYGTTVEDLIGRTDGDFNPNQEEVEHFRQDDLEVMDSRREKLIPEEVITDASGRVRHLQTIKRPIVSSDGRADQVLGVSSDITARKVLEEQLLHAQKMEAIGRLAGGIAHDFNNLLTAILGFCDLLLQELEPGSRPHERADEILKAAERAASLTRQLLVFGRKQVLQPVVFDLSAVIADHSKLLRHLIGEDIELVTVLAPAPTPVKADPGQIGQVLVNLAVNARDSMPRGGRLVIETSQLTLDAAYAALHPEVAPGAHVMLAVSDTGEGIEPDVLPRIFEPYFTTKGPGQGSGLGLATTYGIVKQSGGHITVSSEPGRGTSFRIYLPRADEGEVEARPALQAEAPEGTETVLLVEDEPSVRRLAAETLRLRGFLVLEAENGVDALRIAASHAAPIDMVVTDVVMPQMGGVELAARLREVVPGIRVLYTSGYTDHTIAHQGVLDPGLALLPKPYLRDALARRVREVLDRR